MGGDFNCVLHPSPGPDLDPGAIKVHLSFIDLYKLTDSWRNVNLTAKQFLLFSPVYHLYSQIDFFLHDNGSLPLVTNFQYHSIVISDHSPVQLDMHFPIVQHRSTLGN